MRGERPSPSPPHRRRRRRRRRVNWPVVSARRGIARYLAMPRDRSIVFFLTRYRRDIVCNRHRVGTVTAYGCSYTL